MTNVCVAMPKDGSVLIEIVRWSGHRIVLAYAPYRWLPVTGITKKGGEYAAISSVLELMDEGQR